MAALVHGVLKVFAVAGIQVRRGKAHGVKSEFQRLGADGVFDRHTQAVLALASKDV